MRMRWRVIGAVVGMMAGLAQAADTAELTFKSHGKDVETVSLAELKKRAGTKDLSVHEPHEKRRVTYQSIPVRTLLDKVYGPSWRKADEILFTCSDGYQPSVPVKKFLDHGAYLAYGKPGEKFTLVNTLQNNEKVELGPFYLVWDNLNDPALRAAGAVDLPYQVVSIDLINFSDRFPGMAPPKRRSSQVERGFIAFRQNCMACHSINGQGGGKSVELNYPVSVTEYFASHWLRKWILEPTSVRFNTTMPGLNRDIKDRARVADDIMAYLREMKRHKREPKPAMAE